VILSELLKICDEISPFETQERWDNGGLLVGDPKAQVGDIFLALEADQKVIKDLPNNATLIVHHPLIFSPLKALNFAEYPALLVRELIYKNINLIAMHTNFDKSHLNRYVAKDILGWREFESDDLVCYHQTQFDFEKIVDLVRKAFGAVKALTPPKKRESYRIALCCGSGGSMIGEIDCDVLIAGDLKYHDAIKAKTLGIGVIDAGHYETERFFGEVLAPLLQEKGINAIIAHSQNPFSDGTR
jgi:dinuclear metal center YbgI/SA1388 family protein